MPLRSGTRLGPYEIIAIIGLGGMGEVYKARDTRLDRIVAVKILPSADPGLKQRFEREAKAIAGLSHPHICALYDVGHQDGTDYLVMEYLEGQTLADRLRKGALTLDEALKHAEEIANALENAHRAGIVHRDLKPSNIMLTKTGAKLLDFGLAKLRPQTGCAIAGTTATMTAPLTGSGTILGTLQYMSPEQLEGKDVDQRADIWAFGCIVYEILTGKSAFGGKTQASVIGAIMHGAPPPLLTLQPLTPPALDRIVVRCIAKDPECRWQTVIDLRAELNWIANGATKAGSGAALPRRLERIAWISAAVAMLVAIVLAILLFGRPAEERPVTRLDVVTPPTYDPFAFALSPDGRQMVFAATSETGSRLWRRRLDESIAQPLAGTEGGSAPFWAPDGRSIGFFADSKLKRLDLDGGVPQILASAPEGRGGAWTRDGIIVFTPTTASPLFRVSASGGTAVALTRLDQTQHASHRWPQVLPDGHLIFFALGFSSSGPSGLYLTSLDGASPRRLIAAESAAAYAPPGYLLLVDQGALVARSVNLRSGSVGPPVPIAQPVATDSTIWRSAFSVSTTGVLAHRTILAARRQLVWVDRAGARVEAVGGIDENNQLSLSLSPDGRRIGVQRTAQGAPHTWIFDSGRDVAVRFRDDPAPDARLAWSPDGSRLVFLTAVQGRQMLVEKPISGGAGDEKILLSSGQSLMPLDWSSDGRFLLFSMSEEKTGWDIWALPLTGEGKAFPVLQTQSNEELGQLSHDCRWIAYQSNESGRTEVYVQPFRGRGAKLAVSTGGGIAPRWRRDGRELFYIAPDGAMMAVPLHASVDGHTLETGVPVKLFRDPIVGGGSMLIGGMQQYAVAPNGQRFLINMAISETTAPPITVVLNWTSVLNK